jgi:hypothetical protein
MSRWMKGLGIAVLVEAGVLGLSVWQYERDQTAYRLLRQGTPEALNQVIQRFPRYRGVALVLLGNRFLQEGLRRGDAALIQKAALCYREALRMEPHRMEAKKNLEVAQRHLGPSWRPERREPTLEFRRVFPSIRPLKPTDI